MARGKSWQGRSQGGAQGARAPPLSCRAMTSYERCPTTRFVTLGDFKFTVLELVVATIYHAAHINQQHCFTLSLVHARGKDRMLRKDQYFKHRYLRFKSHLLVRVTCVRVAVLRAAQF